MTALLALAGAVAVRDDEEVRRLLRGALHGEACSLALARPAADVVLAVASPRWDLGAERCIASDGRFTVVAHAALFYRATLDAALTAAGAAPVGAACDAAAAILAAVRCWRWEAVQHLEGEFSFIVWDAQERAIFAARDHSGARPLYHATIGDGIAVASALRLTRAVPGVNGGWNVLALAEDAADIDLADVEETAFSSISRLPAGFTLRWSPGRRAQAERWWEIPIFERDSGVPFEQAAEELRELIADAVVERADLRRGSSVMLSGGYDSSAVFGAGSWKLTGADGRTPLRSVSFSHPVGDPGREDELIEATVRRWGSAPHFLPCDDVPALEPSLARAAARDEPFSHTYELWNRALARGCQDDGSRIALNGNGGDPWFSTSPVFLADLLRQGRLLEFRREWRYVVGAMNWYRLFKVAIQPNLPSGLVNAVARLRGGRRLSDVHERQAPTWIADPVRRSPELALRRRSRQRRRPGESLSAAGRVWFLAASFPERINASVFEICQREGVELRTPLLDARIVRFAATRPRWESNSGRQNKHLLRRSMHGLLPDEVVAARAARTGLPSSYLERTLRAHFAEAREEFANGMLLASLEILDHRKLLQEISSYLAGHWSDPERAVAVRSAIQVEWWLRSLS